MARSLGAEQFGLFSLSTTVASIAAVVAVFGLDTAMTRYIAIMRSRRDEAGLWGALQVGIGASLFFSLFTSFGLYTLATPIAVNLFHEPDLAPLLKLISLVAPFLTLSNILAGATRGFKNMRDSVLAENFLQPTVRFILTAIVAILGLTAARAIIIFGIADFSSSLLLIYLLNKHFSLRQSLSTARRETRTILGFSFPLWLSGLLTTFRGNLQTLLVGSFDSIKGVGIFSIADQANLIGNVFHTSIAQSARPLIAEVDELKDRERMKSIYHTTTKWSVMMNLPFILIIMLFPVQILSIFGKSFIDGEKVIVILAFVSLINVGTGMCGIIIDMTGQTRLKLVNTTVKISLSILLNLLLIPRWGIMGAAVSAVAYTAISYLLPLVQVWYLYRILPYSRSILKPVAAGSAMVGAWLITSHWIHSGTNLPVFLLEVALLFAVYAGTLLLLGFSPEELAILNRFSRRFGFNLH
jgi:O-antigen/teichoic acid export membrane protein